MISPDFLHELDPTWTQSPDYKEIFAQVDSNHDGQITVEDCPFQAGSPDAIMWIKKILVPATHSSQAIDHLDPAWKVFHGDKITGAYKDSPLVPGAHSGDGDYEFLVDKLILQGATPDIANLIAGKVKARLMAGG